MFEGAFYYDFGNGVQVLETEAMRFKLAKWRKKVNGSKALLESKRLIQMYFLQYRSVPHDHKNISC